LHHTRNMTQRNLGNRFAVTGELRSHVVFILHKISLIARIFCYNVNNVSLMRQVN
jgi:hypothetical protein